MKEKRKERKKERERERKKERKIQSGKKGQKGRGKMAESFGGEEEGED